MASTLKAVFGFRHPDSTADLNARQKDLVSKGLFVGGDVIPVPGELKVSVTPFGAMGTDGMITLLTGDAMDLDVIAGQTQYIIGRFEYVANDDPELNLEVLTEGDFDADPDKEELITFAVIDLQPSATEVSASDIDITSSDRVDPQGRSPFRGAVDTEGDLPTETSGDTKSIRSGDLYFVRNSGQFYYWDASNLQWVRVVDTELASDFEEHKNNLDPSARHISPGMEAALDDPASGTSLSSDNVVVDSAVTVLGLTVEEFDVTGVYQIQLTGKYFVGNGDIDKAKNYFFAAKGVASGDNDFVFRHQEQLVGSDNEPIPILGLYVQGAANPASAPTPSTPGPGTLLNPQSDADAHGFVENPVVRFNFEHTDDDGFTGLVAVHAGKRVLLGDVKPENMIKPLAFYPGASMLSAGTSGYNFVASTDETVQKQLRALDEALFQEVNDRIAAIDSAVQDLLSGDNTWQGQQTWQGVNTFEDSNTFQGPNTFEDSNTFQGANTFEDDNEFQGSNTFTAPAETDAETPRQVFPAHATADRTLIFEGGGDDAKVRKYVTQDGVLEIVTNAYYEEGAWLKDLPGGLGGDDAVMVSVSKEFFTVKLWPSSESTPFTETVAEAGVKALYPLDDGSDAIPAGTLTEMVDIARWLRVTGLVEFNIPDDKDIPRQRFPVNGQEEQPRSLIMQFGGNHDKEFDALSGDGAPEARMYRFLEEPSEFVGVNDISGIEFTFNARWMHTLEQWTKDDEGNPAIKFTLGADGFRSQQVNTSTDIWDDDAWDDDFHVFHGKSGFGPGSKIWAKDLEIHDTEPDSPSTTAGFTNTLTAKNFPKAWASFMTDGSGGLAWFDGFNISESSVAGNLGTNTAIEFNDPMVDDTYAIIGNAAGANLFTPNLGTGTPKNTDSFTFSVRNLDDGSIRNLDEEAIEVYVVVFGRQ